MKRFLISLPRPRCWPPGDGPARRRRATARSRAGWRIASRRPIPGTAATTTWPGACRWRWSCRRRPRAKPIWAGASAPRASRRSSTSSSAAIPAPACTIARGSVPRRPGLPAPISWATTTFAARGSLPPDGGNDRTLLCQPGQLARRAVLAPSTLSDLDTPAALNDKHGVPIRCKRPPMLVSLACWRCYRRARSGRRPMLRRRPAERHLLRRRPARLGRGRSRRDLEHRRRRPAVAAATLGRDLPAVSRLRF